MSFTLVNLCIIAAVLFVAGFVKGVIGLGLPTIGVGVLGLMMTPVHAAALLLVPNLATNAWQAFAGPDPRGLMRRIWPMLAAIVAGTIAGVELLATAGSPAASAALGVVLAVYAVLGLSAPRWSISVPAAHWLGPLAGAITGLVTTLTGVFVVPAVPFLQSLGFDRDRLVQALGLSFLVSTLALGASMLHIGFIDTTLGLASLLALIPTAFGMALGQRLRTSLSQRFFRQVFFAGLGALALYLIARSLA